ncbi:MAG: MtrB/PioB family outer membrane beta-barrel protein [Deltaproteobacteria bacterium]|jgi:hypothetical protein|nr:MtrB/PioB family outer membrane beta-barrel protein [Deltaproteobacteria bacterium]
MRNRIKTWLLAAVVISLVLSSWANPGLAEEEPQITGGGQNPPTQEEQAAFNITEGDFFVGYRWISTEDYLKAAEYIYPSSSLTFGLNLLSVPLPYRYHANGEFVSKYDYYFDGGFAYKDLVLFRDILVGVHHSLNRYDYQNDSEAELDIRELSPGVAYNKHFYSNQLLLRFKASDYPFHTFINHRHVERDGGIQQRYLLGQFGSLDKVSESRDIEWNSDAVKLGFNSHLGPIELEYAYDQTEFDPGSNNILVDTYPAFTGTLARPPGNYPHNVIPETESYAHSISMHSSYTGSIVAAASFSNLSQKNNFSLTESTTWKSAFDFSWIPDPKVGLFFKYRRRDVDIDTPADVFLVGYSGDKSYYGTIPSVRHGISWTKDVFSLSTRYKPLNLLTLYANYEFSHLEREEVAEWLVLPDRSNIHRINLKASARPSDSLKVTAKYEYKNYDQPSYNSTPDISNMLWLSTTYTPTPTLTVYLNYTLSLTERDSLLYYNSEPAGLVPEALMRGERDGKQHQLLASMTKEISPKASITLSWFYQRWKIEHDLAYGQWSDTIDDSGDWPYIDYGVPYADESNTFALSLYYMPRDDLRLTAELSHTITEGETGYNYVAPGVLFSLSSFSELEVNETIFSFDIAKKLNKDWELGLRNYLGSYNDKVSDHLDGEVYSSTFYLKRDF